MHPTEVTAGDVHRVDLATGVRRVVITLREPAVLADCAGVERLRAEGVEVVELTDLADQVRTINARILRRDGGSVS